MREKAKRRRAVLVPQWLRLYACSPESVKRHVVKFLQFLQRTEIKQLSARSQSEWIEFAKLQAEFGRKDRDHCRAWTDLLDLGVAVEARPAVHVGY